MRVYRNTPQGKKAVLKAAANWAKTHKQQRDTIVRRYRERTGYYVPLELRQLRQAVKRLEQALAAAENR